jgi:hypothetical protein
MIDLGNVTILVRGDLENMLEEARQRVRDAGLPEAAVERVNMLGFQCTEHGAPETFIAYRGGVLLVYCRECNREVALIAVATEVTVISEIEENMEWN